MDHDIDNINAFYRWQFTDPGQCIHALECNIINTALNQQIFACGIQVGGRPLLLKPCVHHAHIVKLDIAIRQDCSMCQLIGSIDALPYADNIFDVIICPHLHECHHQPKVLFDEMYRVLKPQGRLIVMGIKRYGMWGIEQAFTRQLSWMRHCFSQRQIYRLLADSGFNHDATHHFGHLPLRVSGKQKRRWHYLNAFFSIVFPYLSAAYAIEASKQKPSITWVGSTRIPVQRQWSLS